VLNFHCSFQHKWCQRIEVRGRKRSAECRDFVLPTPGSTPMFSVHYQETSKSGITVDEVDTVEIVTGPRALIEMSPTDTKLLGIGLYLNPQN